MLMITPSMIAAGRGSVQPISADHRRSESCLVHDALLGGAGLLRDDHEDSQNLSGLHWKETFGLGLGEVFLCVGFPQAFEKAILISRLSRCRGLFHNQCKSAKRSQCVWAEAIAIRTALVHVFLDIAAGKRVHQQVLISLRRNGRLSHAYVS